MTRPPAIDATLVTPVQFSRSARLRSSARASLAAAVTLLQSGDAGSIAQAIEQMVSAQCDAAAALEHVILEEGS